jgi:CRISPR-associated protein Cmr1
MNRTNPPAAPAFEDLPPRRAAGMRKDFTVSLKIVTPILGGGYRTRALDDVDIIRVPTVRGHLRFWWRALFASRETSTSLYEAETTLWGGPGGGPDKAPARRSHVDVRIEVTSRGSEDGKDIDPARTEGYVLFPARGERSPGQVTRDPATPRRTDVAFTLRVTAPADHIVAVRMAVQAWILFGGYGGRTRRGLGGLTVTGPDAAKWLPHAGRPLTDELKRLFGRDVFAVDGRARQTPTLAGAALYTIGRVENQGVTAWLAAVEALRSFRQGTSAERAATSDAAENSPSRWARQPSGDPRRPSISNWPEADKIRHLADRELRTGPYSHPPRHNGEPVWPRAGFGLPIIGRFQTTDRKGGRCHEPPPYKLTWGEPAGHNKYRPRKRLASPLIIKALPLVDGRFVAIALWLHRDWPAGKIILVFKDTAVPGSAAPFDALTAPGEVPLFAGLADRPTLRFAFLDWLVQARKAVIVFPHRDVVGGAR